MIITDLSYLNEVTEETVFGADGTPSYNIDFSKKINVRINIKVNQKVNVKGAFNELAFTLTAMGPKGAGTEVQTAQTTVEQDGYYIAQHVGSVNSFAR